MDSNSQAIKDKKEVAEEDHHREGNSLGFQEGAHLLNILVLVVTIRATRTMGIIKKTAARGMMTVDLEITLKTIEDQMDSISIKITEMNTTTKDPINLIEVLHP